MKIAAQTVIWGNHIEDLAGMLDLIAAHGCKGVEFGQRPEELGDAKTLRQMLADRDLTLLGLSGGNLRERMRYCGDVLRPKYLYVEDWDDKESRAAIDAGFTLALHQRLFKPVHRLEQAEAILRAHPQLRFLPDTAHLTIAGDSPADAVSKWVDRLAAIHLKDWTPIYGRSSHRYSRGFVQLGSGIVKTDKLFERLLEDDYHGWLVFEQASPDNKPEEVVIHATRWLSAKCGILTRRTRSSGRRTRKPRRSLPNSLSRETSPLPAVSFRDENEFLERIIKTAIGYSHSCYPALAEAAGKLLKARLIMLCACSPAADVLSVVGVYPYGTRIGDYFANYRNSLSSVAVERQTVTAFDLQETEPGAEYGQPQARLCYQELVSKLSLRNLMAVPVQDPQDPRQVRIILHVFLAEHDLQLPEEYLARIGKLVAQAADDALDERCALAAANVSIRAGECQQADAFLTQLRDLLLDVLHCETLTIFLVNDAGDRLEEAKSTHLRWNVSPQEQFYRLGEGLTGKVWERKEALLSRDPDHEPGAANKSDESKPTRRPAFLCAPMMDVTGTVVGVVRCQNKRGEKGAFHMFSEDDLAVLDAACQAAVPHLQVLLSKERRAKALRRLTHELNHPLVALRGVADRMRQELVRRRGSAEAFFSEEYLDDVDSWTGLMRGLLGNANFFRLADRKIAIDQRRVLFFGDVIMPTVSQVKELLVDRDFEPGRIIALGFREIPRLWLDKPLVTQVVFNLLSNAIKYAHKEPALFRILIKGRETETHYEVDFSDWGYGLPEHMKEAIFEEGVRTKEAERLNVTGDGLGLWVARRVMEANYGQIAVTSCSRPTTFTLSFPKWLSSRKTLNRERQTI